MKRSRPRLVLYGWFDQAEQVYRVSRYPADAPVRPSVTLEDEEQVRAMVERKKATIHWWPPLPNERAIA